MTKLEQSIKIFTPVGLLTDEIQVRCFIEHVLQDKLKFCHISTIEFLKTLIVKVIKNAKEKFRFQGKRICIETDQNFSPIY